MANYVFGPNNPASTTADNDHAVDILTGDSVRVLDGGTITASGLNANGINGESGHTLRVNGLVSSTNGNGISAGGGISIDQPASVFGAQTGILLNGSLNSIDNLGTISGSTGIKRLSYDFGFTRIVNSGSITGTGEDGIYVSGNASIENAGNIGGDNSGIFLTGTGHANIRNSGTISGLDAINIGSSLLEVTIVNIGRIEGNLQLGGASLYEGHDGIITGEVRGGDHNDRIFGGRTSETFRGAGGGDSINGGGGNDTLEGGKGNDTLDGGAGVDTAVFSGARASYDIVTNANGTITVKDLRSSQDGSDNLADIRFAKFADQTVTLVNSAPTSLALSNASVAENAPAFTVVGRLSAHDADGDAVRYSLSSNPDGAFTLSGDTLVLARPLDHEAKAQYSVGVTVTDIYGAATTQTFTVTATDVAEHLVLRGTSRSDRLTGLNGDDQLWGKTGKDVLTGGAGQDKFVFDTRASKSNMDTITDFNVRDDAIWLENRIFSKLGRSGSEGSPAKVNSAFFKVGSKATDENDYLVYNKSKGVLYYDADGSGAGRAVEIAKFSNKARLTKDDFFLI